MYKGRAALHMTTMDIYCTRYGEMIDMLTFSAVDNGTAKLKPKKQTRTILDILAMR